MAKTSDMLLKTGGVICQAPIAHVQLIGKNITETDEKALNQCQSGLGKYMTII